jgi:hypothetical protein
MRIFRVFQRLPGMFLSRLVIFFSVTYRRGAVRVRRGFVQFSSALVRIIWHGITS